MCEFKLVDTKVASFIMEEKAFGGVKRIAEKVVQDIDRVASIRAAIKKEIEAEDEYVVVVGTWGKSDLLNELSVNKGFDGSVLEAKREVYSIQLIEQPFPNVKSALVIAGSDKRGTIYGLFQLSELIGVTPYSYWGDVTPKEYKKITFKKDATQKEIEKAEALGELIISEGINYVSKEPSVKYRGFFINDEWPCFGNWTFSHFNGFTAQMYDKVFEFLLRLKGNYLWPAMWTSSFALDGPGLANAELADLYGVVIGNSHHEPCLRASEEWDIYKGHDTPYGTEWNYATNKDGLINYWADGLKRSGKYESIITIGMRGERDSSMLGPDASLGENINLLKDIITEQRKLIKEYVPSDYSKIPQLLALYKEVEGYFYGDENTPGLKDWEELEGVTFMLCEDNFGNMRTLPTELNRNRVGGWGMYYHFDYHGAPISYEWVNSTPLSKVWEQMTMAYEYGVKELWIVNVGDLKFNEVPLGYFMALAYDFEQWGTSHPNTIDRYMIEWTKKQFGKFVSDEIVEKLCFVFKEYTTLNGLRRPEALNETIYHAAHYNEAERMLQRVEYLEEQAELLLEELPQACKDAYYSMIYFPVVASANLLKMHLSAGINHLYAEQGRLLANKWAERVDTCIQKDRGKTKEFAEFLEGKWSGMERAHHIGFTNWNDQDYRYPTKCLVEAANEPRLVVAKKGDVKTYTSSYFVSMLEVNEFLSVDCEAVVLELINGGIGSYEWTIENTCDWISLSADRGTVIQEEQLKIRVLRDKLPDGLAKDIMTIKAGNEKVLVQVEARKINTQGIPSGTFLERDGIITIEAEHYTEKRDSSLGKYVKLESFGRTLSGMKAFPVTSIFKEEEGPSLTYSIWVEEAGKYVLEVQTAPSNPVRKDGSLCFVVKVNEESKRVINTIPEGYRGGDPDESQWSQGVLENIHKTYIEINLNVGLNNITLQAIDAPLVLERLLVYKKENKPKASYLGPLESYRIP